MVFKSKCISCALAILVLCISGKASAQAVATDTAATSTQASAATSTAVTTAPPTTVPARNVHNAAQVEAAVRAAFADIPVMIDVARCESKFRQFADSGNVFMGGTNGQMVGIFQIYGTLHRPTALSLGMDIDTVAGNIAYARYLYARQGTGPWLDSMSCWNPNPVEGSAGSVIPPAVLTLALSLGSNNAEVLALQKILNAHGFPVASSGPGSPGSETTLFGSLTRNAVRQFQCSQKIVCSGDEYTTSYGVVGPRTRAALAQVVANGGGVSASPTPAPADNSAAIAALKAQIASLQQQLSALEAAQH